jgi:hypothetical protein
MWLPCPSDAGPKLATLPTKSYNVMTRKGNQALENKPEPHFAIGLTSKNSTVIVRNGTHVYQIYLSVVMSDNRYSV